eukprot:CAMPEP_0197322386 /NCGR_PEP_ID=MMETSP0891-20130614/69711_1 /TAXON_ID=44058 ORGANISM="Aureoumbra lagunensis, Strain CCMP1510" /NCGR_SAMPLE_ID=MMETSP0891 /ASSEMBLY_ACC=CAM_ASM_000534 /LENGTH=74 /DNA_ID=CAMNT_0042814779 /DNA_START=12 /DNA_END=232 /DNA_ORIENTATION=-
MSLPKQPLPTSLKSRRYDGANKITSDERLETLLVKGPKINILAKALPPAAFRALESTEFRQVTELCAQVLVMAG